MNASRPKNGVFLHPGSGIYPLCACNSAFSETGIVKLFLSLFSQTGIIKLIFPLFSQTGIVKLIFFPLFKKREKKSLTIPVSEKGGEGWTIIVIFLPSGHT